MSEPGQEGYEYRSYDAVLRRRLTCLIWEKSGPVPWRGLGVRSRGGGALVGARNVRVDAQRLRSHDGDQVLRVIITAIAVISALRARPYPDLILERHG